MTTSCRVRLGQTQTCATSTPSTLACLGVVEVGHSSCGRSLRRAACQRLEPQPTRNEMPQACRAEECLCLCLCHPPSPSPMQGSSCPV